MRPARFTAFVLVVTACSLLSHGSARAIVGGPVIEPKLMATFTTVSGLNSNYLSSSSTGYQVGADLRFGKTFWLRPGLHYRRLEMGIERVTGGSDGVPLSGLYFPLVVGAGIDLKIVSFAGGVGPTYQTVLDVGENDFGITDEDVTGGFFGAKAMGQVSLFGITVEGAYEHSLSNVLENATEYGDSALDIWSVGLGMKF